jgi:alanyl-tRNA synthetase
MKQSFDAIMLRNVFIDFFIERGHAKLPSASLIPENDPTILFTTAGMHPLVPFLNGERHPLGTRLTNIQKCLRTQDIEEVGDGRHTTFFEMLGAWSLGDYSKEQIIPWTFDFFTRILGLDPQRLYISVFRGDAGAPPDGDSIPLWQTLFRELGLEAKLAPMDDPDANRGYRIFQYGRDKNWWGPVGGVGPCGPDTEIFYRTDTNHRDTFGAVCHPNCDCGRFIEIANDVFIEFTKRSNGNYELLKQPNIDIGWGLERLLAICQGRTSVFQTDLFSEVIRWLEKNSGSTYRAPGALSKSIEIVADHVRSAVFILGDPRGVVPSNVDQGYVLRRFIRRAIRHARLLRINKPFLQVLADFYIDTMGSSYPEIVRNRDNILEQLKIEEQAFGTTIASGERHFAKLVADLQAKGNWRHVISGDDVFRLYDTFGFPLEMTRELAQDHSITVDEDGFYAAFARHQAISRAGAHQKFAGGLIDQSDRSVRMHTATHLLHMALRRVLGPHVRQKGSNITPERLRFDFLHFKKMTSEEVLEVETMVNEQIDKSQEVSYLEMPLTTAKETDVVGDFEERYGEVVKVYRIGDFSREICGGPHVANTRFIGRFKIVKEEASSKGVRRIRATVGEPEETLPSPIPIAQAASKQD